MTIKYVFLNLQRFLSNVHPFSNQPSFFNSAKRPVRSQGHMEPQGPPGTLCFSVAQITVTLLANPLILCLVIYHDDIRSCYMIIHYTIVLRGGGSMWVRWDIQKAGRAIQIEKYKYTHGHSLDIVLTYETKRVKSLKKSPDCIFVHGILKRQVATFLVT